ncbi:MAG: GNAT family N-acetyltransferase [Candidatus Roizmanbacteria bacterium]|nr:GNAT family N-acetyltransferase [Candidatus Roizmanbacteria bacterium]
MNLLHISIESERLKLIPTTEKYAQEIFKEFSNDLTVFMYPKPAKKIDETLSYISLSRQTMEKGEQLQVVILNKLTNEFIGHGGISGLNTDTPELGIWIKKSAHGNKFGREAVKALKEWTDKNKLYTYIMYPVDKRNIPSRKIAESLGGVIEDEYKKENMSGNILDEVEYRIYPKK